MYCRIGNEENSPFTTSLDFIGILNHIFQKNTSPEMTEFWILLYILIGFLISRITIEQKPYNLERHRSIVLDFIDKLCRVICKLYNDVLQL